MNNGIIDIKLTSNPIQAPIQVEAEIEIRVLITRSLKMRILNIFIIRKEILIYHQGMNLIA